MEKWDVFLIISSIVTFLLAVAKPVVDLTKTICTLNTQIKQLKTVIIEINNKNENEKRLLWRHNEKQDKKIENHEYRIEVLEGGQNESKQTNYN